MKFVFAPDSFKGSLSAIDAVSLLTEAARRHFPGCEVFSVPVADGGEGTVDALLLAMGGKRVAHTVMGPLGRPVEAYFGLFPDGKTAVVEMAAASGLPLIDHAERNPLKATSFGTGELILKACSMGIETLLVGIGGSATNDGGMGMLTALGARFLDKDGNALLGSGGELALVDRLSLNLHPVLKNVEIKVICDVTNPLLGENGATAIYGPQKGVTEEMYPMLEAGMARYAEKMAEATGREFASFPGAGAAGGMGAALGGVLKATLRSGIELVLDTVGFDDLIENCDLVVTGEGRIDRQSVEFGKVPTGVAKRCAKKDVPVVAMVGGMAAGAEKYYDVAESTIFPIVDGPMPLDRAMQEARPLFAAAADRMFRAVKIGMKMQK